MTREEAIEVYNGLINEKIKAAFEFFAPELCESEDEIHRKWILEYLYDGLRKADEQFKDQFKSAIDWLEKQKEQKPAEWSEEDEKMLARIIERGQSQIQIFETGLLPEHIAWLKSLRPDIYKNCNSRRKPGED